MRSGYDDYQGIWGNEYYDEEFDGIADRAFTQRIFAARDTLISIQPVTAEETPEHHQERVYQDGTVEVPYDGQAYDLARFKLAKAGWDHEHCLICRFSIEDGHTYWVNAKGLALCDACHEHYMPGTRG